MEKDNRLGILGCGNMGEAIAKGIVNAGVIRPIELYVYDIEHDKAGYLKEVLDVNVTASAEELVNNCSAILLAVKPQDVEDILREIWHLFDSSKLLISIAAGVTIERIKKVLNEEVRIIRAMPNMAAIVNESVTAICCDNYASDDDRDLARKIFKSVGDIVEVDECQMDAVTAVSGSGPAYFFYLTEILEKAACGMGIDKDKARFLAVRTVFGSAALLRDSGLSAETLRSRVTSKGGTTEAAFKVFGNKKLTEILQEGIRAAVERSRELSGSD